MTDHSACDSQDRSDQLSPNRALQESTGATGSQRIGNNGPVANPTVSFPDDTADREASSPGQKTGAGGGS
jgi:hypothetical protein